MRCANAVRLTPLRSRFNGRSDQSYNVAGSSAITALMPDSTNTAAPAEKPTDPFQFRLRTLLIAVPILAIPCGYVAQLSIVRERRAVLAEVTRLGGKYIVEAEGLRDMAGRLGFVECWVMCLGRFGSTSQKPPPQPDEEKGTRVN